ncbi:DUF6170 family protein [Thalassotalea euphylliae]|uniref:DUF6170 family protein n=1 Tax=Thalassotalea euphylliae TaxID=1655234 RepID=UPI00362E0505
MKLYFSSKDIPALNECSIQERNEKIHTAQQKLTVPEKLLLNILKLFLLVPPFIYLARQDWGNLSVTLLISLIGYGFAFRPIMFRMIEKKLK